MQITVRLTQDVGLTDGKCNKCSAAFIDWRHSILLIKCCSLSLAGSHMNNLLEETPYNAVLRAKAPQ